MFPSSSTTYVLTASGPGGTATGLATVSVTAPPPPPPPPAPSAPKQTIESRISSDVQDAFFDYDKSDIREDARTTLTRDADALKSALREFPNDSVTIEGHCDERGSAEYNLGLGDRRSASAAKSRCKDLSDREKRLMSAEQIPASLTLSSRIVRLSITY